MTASSIASQPCKVQTRMYAAVDAKSVSGVDPAGGNGTDRSPSRVVGVL